MNASFSLISCIGNKLFHFSLCFSIILYFIPFSFFTSKLKVIYRTGRAECSYYLSTTITHEVTNLRKFELCCVCMGPKQGSEKPHTITSRIETDGYHPNSLEDRDSHGVSANLFHIVFPSCKVSKSYLTSSV